METDKQPPKIMAIRVNNLGKAERNQKIKEGECIIPFKYKRETHNKCFPTPKGEICATSVSKFGTLKTYGYCVKNKTIKKDKSTKSKTVERTKLKLLRKKKRKLILIPKKIEDSKIKSKDLKLSLHSSSKMSGYNEELSKIFGELYQIMISKGEPFRARAYKKAQETILNAGFIITADNFKDLQKLPGIGETIVKKVEEYITTGKLKAIEKEKTNPIIIFTQIYGVGPKKAKELVEKNGVSTISELREAVKENPELLNDKQKIGLQYYEDILERIPRSEIDKYKTLFESIMYSVCDKSECNIEIVGSYRRGVASSGDIDVILSHSQNDKKIFKQFIDKCISDGVITEVLSRGNTKSLVVGTLPEGGGGDSESGKYRRIDFMFTSPEEYPFAILYFTGSATFNTRMRQRALDLGFSMNEHGLYHMVKGKKGTKIDVTFSDEEGIFSYLGMKYKTPVERKNGNAVELIGSKGLTDAKTKDTTKDIKKTKIIKKKPKKLVLVEDDKSGTQNVVFKKTVKKKPKALKKDKKTEMEWREHLTLFAKTGIDYLHGLSESTIGNLLIFSNHLYYNETPILSDGQYDILKEYMETHYPKNKALNVIGAPIEINKQKVKLPYFMGSMDKIKPDTKILGNWKQKYQGPYVLSTKLDGISGLYVLRDGEKKLYTRGNGTYGQDITHLIPYLRLPTELPVDETDTPYTSLAIRGELIMKKDVFETKYAGEWSNARNMVSGIVNSKTHLIEKYQDIDFVAYEVIDPELSPGKQFQIMNNLTEKDEIITAKNIILSDSETGKLTNEYLSELLVDWRTNYTYEIDGVIVTNDAVYSRKDCNPDHSFAFKMVLSDQVVEAKVVDVIWAASKDGYLKPRIRIEPVTIGGAKIEYATAFNGAFVRDRKIGIGAVIQLVRSGDVIPHIMDVITPAPEAKMPDVEYKWNETGVDIILVDKSADPTVLLKNLTGFFVTLGVEGLSSGNIKRIMDAGYTSVEGILAMTIDDFLTVNGFKQKMANKIYNSIHSKIDESTLAKLMSATNLFGRGMGERRMNVILEAYPDILTVKKSESEKTKMVASLPGFAAKTASHFVSHIDDFMDFVHAAGLESKVTQYKKDLSAQKKDVDESHPLYGKKIVMTGFRNKELEKKIKEVGGTMSSSVSKNVFIVILKDLDNIDTGKAIKAKDLGIKLMILQDFKQKYF